MNINEMQSPTLMRLEISVPTGRVLLLIGEASNPGVTETIVLDFKQLTQTERRALQNVISGAVPAFVQRHVSVQIEDLRTDPQALRVENEYTKGWPDLKEIRRRMEKGEINFPTMPPILDPEFKMFEKPLPVEPTEYKIEAGSNIIEINLPIGYELKQEGGRYFLTPKLSPPVQPVPTVQEPRVGSTVTASPSAPSIKVDVEPGPGMRTVTKEDGGTRIEPIPPDEAKRQVFEDPENQPNQFDGD